MQQPHPNAVSSASHLHHAGAQLRDMRQHFGLSLSQVSGRLHIRSHYLEAIEKGDLSVLPGKVYTQGYIQSYAEFLGLNPQDILSQYEGFGHSMARQHTVLTEPTKQQGIPAWRWVAAGLAIIYLLYVLMGQIMPQEPSAAVQSISPLPERLKQQRSNALLMTDKNRQCLSAEFFDALLPCYYAGDEPEKHLRSIMELKL